MSTKLLTHYFDFRGGLNTDSAPDLVADNELVIADNVDLDERGAVTKRKGTVPLNATSYGAQVEKLIEWTRNDGSAVLLAVVGTTLCKINDDGTKTDLITLDEPDIGWFVFQDKFWFTGKQDGVDKFWQYDGSTISEVTPNSATDNDLTPIKRCRWFVWHPKSMRVFAALDPEDKAALYYSEPNDPTYFKQTSKLYPTTGDGPVTGLAIFGDAMLAFYNNSVWAWKGADPAADATWEKPAVGDGTFAGRSIALTPGGLTFVTKAGIVTMSPGLLDYNVVMIATESLIANWADGKVANIVRSVASGARTCAVYDRLNNKYLLAYSEVEERPDKILVLDWTLKAFTRYVGLQVNDFCQRADGELLIASNGYILKMGQGYKDFDVATGDYKAIEFGVKTKQFNLGYPFHEKKFRKLFLAARQYGAELSSATVIVNYDYDSEEFTNVELDESFTWGEDWGKLWGWSDLVAKEARLHKKALRAQVEISNDVIDEPITVYGIAFEYKLRRPKGVKVDG